MNIASTHLNNSNYSGSSEKKRILVVDDNDEMASCNKEILEMAQYEVVTASSGASALQCVLEPVEFDLILMDLFMDDISGPEFLIILENKHPEIFKKTPVAFVSAMDKAPASKAVGFIQKPFSIKLFLESVQSFIRIES